MREFKSKYGIGDLVAYKLKPQDQTNDLGFIRAVTFYGTVSGVEGNISYKIERANQLDFDNAVDELSVIKLYKDVT